MSPSMTMTVASPQRADVAHPLPSFDTTALTLFTDPSPEAREEVLMLMEISKKKARGGMALSNAANIVDLEDGRVVKVGQKVAMTEALAMEYVRHATTIPVPKVHMVFERDQETYVVMDRVPGQAFSTVYFDISTEDIRRVTWQCAGYIEQLRELGTRSVLSAKTAMGQWPNGPFRNIHFLEPCLDDEITSMDTFYRYWYQRALRRDSAVDAPAEGPIGDADIVLSHGDFSPQNIMVQDGKVTGVLDWETFGWYPRFWDTMRFRGGCFMAEAQDAADAVFGNESELSNRVRRLILRCF